MKLKGVLGHRTAILLGAHAEGLGAKPQFSVAKYHDVCRDVLGDAHLPPDRQVVCGLSLGWPARRAAPPAPGFFPSRLPVDATTTWAVDDAWAADGAGS